MLSTPCTAACFGHGVPSLFRVLRIGIPVPVPWPLQGEGPTKILLLELVQELCLGSWWTAVAAAAVDPLHGSCQAASCFGHGVGREETL